MAYSADTFVADEQPTTAKWNKLWSNDASFNDGTGIADDAILNRHLADNSVLSAQLDIISTTDANGWTVYDLGSTTIYRKRVTFSQTIAGLAVLTISSSNLPSGLSTIGTRLVHYNFVVTSNAGALQLAFEGSSSSTAFQFTTATTDTTSRSYTGFIDLLLIGG